MRKQNNLQNLSYLSEQIEHDRAKKQIQKTIDKQFYKTHFGPEETDELIQEKLRVEHMKKSELKYDLQEQINNKKMMSSTQKHQERTGDLNNLDVCQNTYIAEERAIQAKNIKEK